MRMKNFHLLICCCFFLFCVGCSEKSCKQRHFIKYEEAGEFAQNVNMSLFCDFYPGMRFEHVPLSYHPCKKEWVSENQTQFRLFYTDVSKVAVAKELYVSGSGRVESWSVYAYPLKEELFSLEAMFSTDLINRIKNFEQPYSLIVHSAVEPDKIWCSVKDGGVAEIRWIKVK